MLTQRIFGVLCGYEDCNDFNAPYDDPVFKLALKRSPERGLSLASQPTLSRLENSVGKRELFGMAETLVEVFIESHRSERVKRIVLDADGTDDPAHGQQELVCALLRTGTASPGQKSFALVKRLVKRLRSAFPGVEIVFRGDSGFSLPDLYAYMDDSGVGYAISMGKNRVLLSKSAAGPVVNVSLPTNSHYCCTRRRWC